MILEDALLSVCNGQNTNYTSMRQVPRRQGEM